MKKVGISLILVIGTLMSLVSQTWFEGSPNWKYTVDYWDCNIPTAGYDLIKYVKDTLIDGLEMKVFEETVYRNTMGDVFTYAHDKIYYENGGIVYLYSNGNHVKLYDFTKQIGEIDTIEWQHDELCDSVLLLRLDAIESFELANDFLDVQKWSQLIDSTVYPDAFIVVEKIGARYYHPFEALDWNCWIHTCYPHSFNCYYNEDLGQNYPINADCSFLVSTGEPLDHQGISTIFPNPTFGQVNIESNTEISTIRVYNLDGTLIMERKLGENIDLEEAPIGLYYVKIIFQNGAEEVKPIAKI